ncbi:PIG-L deacetylase family protein [Paractinoplanes atraurantiacus]|uniref:N-acetylglucosaminyl deacetylase, LmbE family n=1 Tax=Paractinoplanes atraurantiacus TaxID=1036182 RepID=A0A285GM07_9ACTN|nr:PIG-L deacetylase family protein [Actinoplanes atraurantiacus]SNY24468.1 N-acetylglucosaminyl deacetylase, LmbE family [Actinoplanes atraurantiacus]
MTDKLTPLPEDWTRALCVVAHPDDMEFGGAGAVAAWTAAGKTVVYLLVTRGEAGIDGMPPAEAAAVREAEQRAGAGLVGVKEVEFLDHPDGLVEHGTALRRDIAAAIRRHRPELIVGYNHRDETFTGKWNTPDHRNTGRALLDAVGDAANRWVFPDAGPGPWAGVKYVAMHSSPRATHAVDVTGSVDAAVASLEAHREYLRGLGYGDTSVRAPLVGLYTQTGKRFGDRLAVGFEMVDR